MKIRTKIKKGFTLVELLVVIAIMASLGAVGYVGVLAFMNAGDKQAAGANIKQVGTALTNFQRDFGSFPDDQSANSKKMERWSNDCGSELSGDTSNAYLRQLFRKKGAVSEANFYAKLPGMVEGDDKIKGGACLEPGECAFAYVIRKPDETAEAKPSKRKGAKAAEPAGGVKKSVPSRGTCPILFCCIKSDNQPISGETLTFDMEPFSEYAIMYTTDGKLVALEDEKIEVDEGDTTTGRLHPDYNPFPEGNDPSKFFILPPAR